MTDNNMDHNNTYLNNNHKITNIIEIAHYFLSNNSYTTHNKASTSFINQDPISCINHIYSNIPHKVTHVTTHNTSQSDHALLTAKYHSKAPITPQKHVYTRPKYLLTEHTLNQYLANNDIL